MKSTTRWVGVMACMLLVAACGGGGDGGGGSGNEVPTQPPTGEQPPPPPPPPIDPPPPPSPPIDPPLPPPPGMAPQLELLAGTYGGAGHADGAAPSARFNLPTAVVVDAQGNRYVADRGNHVIRRIAPDGEVATLAGMVGQAGAADGTGSAARFFRPTGLALDGAGSLYIANAGHHTIRKLRLSDGEVTTVAGKPGVRGADAGGAGQPATLDEPVALAFLGNQLLVVERGNHAIRWLAAPQLMVPFAGTIGQPGDAEPVASPHLAHFRYPNGIAVNAATGHVYVADQANCVVRVVTQLAVQLVAGASGDCRSVDGGREVARLDLPGTSGSLTLSIGGIVVDPTGRIFVGDNVGLRDVALNGSARTLSIGISAAGSNAAAMPPWQPNRIGGFAFDAAGRMLLAEPFRHTIDSIELTGSTSGVVTTVAGQPPGSGSPVIKGDLGAFNGALAQGRDGSLLIAGAGVRRITNGEAIEPILTLSAGQIGVSSVAEAPNGMLFAVVDRDVTPDLSGPYAEFNGYLNGELKFSIETIGPLDDDVVSPAIAYPSGIDIDSQGRAVVADSGAAVVRRVSQDGVVTRVAGRPGQYGHQVGDALDEALFTYPIGIAVAKNDDIFVLDYGASNEATVVRISAVNGRDVVSLVASDLGDAVAIAVDQWNNVYVAQQSQCVIVRIRPNGERAIFAGRPGVCAFKSGPLPGHIVTDNPFGPLELAVRNNHLVMTMEAGIVEIGPLPQ